MYQCTSNTSDGPEMGVVRAHNRLGLGWRCELKVHKRMLDGVGVEVWAEQLSVTKFMQTVMARGVVGVECRGTESPHFLEPIIYVDYLSLSKHEAFFYNIIIAYPYLRKKTKQLL